MSLPVFKSKKLTKTQSDLQFSCFEVISLLNKHNGYIKGFGSKSRLMTQDHSPLMNIDNKIVDVLKFNKVIYLSGLVYVPADKCKDILTQDKIELPL